MLISVRVPGIPVGRTPVDVVVVDLVGAVVLALLFQFPSRVGIVALFELMPVAQGVERPVALLQRRSDRAAGERVFLATEIRPVPFSCPRRLLPAAL